MTTTMQDRKGVNLWTLDLDEKHIDTITTVAPDVSIDEIREKGALAAELEKRAGGKVRIKFVPTMFFEDDREATGHLFHVHMPMQGEHEMLLDDRALDGNGPCWQLHYELKRVGDYYHKLAERVERANNRAGKGKAVGNG